MINTVLHRTVLPRTLLVYFSFFLFSLVSNATESNAWEDSIVPMPTNNKASGGKYIFVYPTKKAITSDSALQFAQKHLFKKNQKDVYSSLTSVKTPVWLYFKTDSFLTNEDHLLILENCNFNLISLYKYEDSDLKLLSIKGMGMAYQKDNLFPEQIAFHVQPNTVYFIEAYDFYTALFPIFVRTNIINTQQAVIKNFFNAFYWGVISVMALVALFFFIRSKERVFIYYSFFLFGTILLNTCLEGYLFAYVWPTHPEINAYKIAIYAISAITTPLFVYHFLEIKSYYAGVKFVFILITLIFFSVAAVNYLGFFAEAMYILQITAFLQIVVYIMYGVGTYKKGNKNALYFIFAWSAYLISIIIAVLSASNVIPGTSYVNNYVQIGTLIQGIFFSFIMAGKYQLYKLTHIKSQEKIIEVLKEREYLLTSQNDTLEATVYVRTQELNRTNKELNKLNRSLNELVDQKTAELQKSLEEINNTNNQLEQFNFITSHNLRGPISTLKGLFELYYQEDNLSEQRVYIDKSNIVINRMDEILKDLNKILSYKNTEIIKELIDFETIISSNLKQLDIKRNSVNMYVNPTLKIFGIKSFYESIFYNIISNAQKYKDSTRTLRIDIQINRVSDHLYSIHITDNGIGMDASKIGDKLFGFYKRFHLHVEGKGLGLYITKSQVEILGGTIRAESAVGIGTTFIIELPC